MIYYSFKREKKGDIESIIDSDDKSNYIKILNLTYLLIMSL